MATPLNTAAALDAACMPMVTRTLPPALQRLLASGPADSNEGRLLRLSEAAERLEVTRATACAWIESKRLLAWRAARGSLLVPAEQIMGPGEVVPGIERVLAGISEPAAAWDFLVEESPYVTPDALRRPIDALKAGQVDAVIAAANSYLDAFT